MWFMRRIIKLNKILEFESGVNSPIQLRSPNLILKFLLFLSEISGKFFFNSLTRKLYRHEVNERIVEIPFVLRNISLPTGANILDFGCNRSFLSMEIASLGYKVTGVDLLPYLYQHSNFSFTQGNLLDLKFQSEHFDAIVAVSSIEHAGLGFYGDSSYPEADLAIMKEFYRILKSGGIVVLTVPFGRANCDSFTRIYDEDAVVNLTELFKITREEYYVKKVGENEWNPTEQEFIGHLSSECLLGGVACLVCMKE